VTRLRPLAPVAPLVLAVLAGGALPGIAGAALTYPALGVFPGMAVALLVGWRQSLSRRWLLGLTLAPLASAGAGWALGRAGVALPDAARAITWGGAVLWAALELLRARAPEPAGGDEEPVPAWVTRWSLGLAAVVALPPLCNAFIRVHGDGWVHAGIAYEIATRGFPPQDPRFAGLPLNYVWFYNLFLAQLGALHGQSVLDFMVVMNVVLAALIVRLAYRLGFAVWRDRRAATGAAILLTLGFNAGAWLLWPLRLATAFTGQVHGMGEVRRLLANTHLGDDRVFFMLGAPLAHEVSFLDKYLLGTALTYAWALIVLYLDALARWMGEPRRELLVWGALAAMGLQLFHFVPGLSVIPVAIGALVLLVLLRVWWPWLPPPSRALAFALATLVGALVVLPYTLSITRGWSAGSTGVPERHFHLGIRMLWTLVTSCAVAMAFAWRPLARLARERRVEGIALACFLLGMTFFALVVHLTEDNESKFAFQVFIPLAVFGGAALLPGLAAARARWGTARVAVGLAVLCLNIPLLVVGYLVDPRGATAPELDASAGVLHVEAWIRDTTPPRAVFVDNRFRDLLMVRARRRLYYGSAFGPERAGFPLAQVTERRAVMADLYGAEGNLDRDAAALARLADPVFVLYRPEDSAPAATGTSGSTSAAPGAPWRSLERRGDLFRLAYARDGYRVYALSR
jgi:hypothetical protein